MEDQTMWTAALAAQFFMGHCVPSPHMARDRRTIRAWSWDVDQVRQALHVPLTDLWGERVLELEAQGLASFTFYSYAGSLATPGWEDEPRERHGTVDIHAAGVLRLATLYGRPYVRFHESPAVLQHWLLVRRESAARSRQPYDQDRLAREWPEATRLWNATLAEREGEGDGD